MMAGIADAVVSDGADAHAQHARRYRLRAIVTAPLLLLSLLALGTSLLARPASADVPVEINSEADLVLRPYVRAVVEKDISLTPEDAAKLGADGIPHPSSPPSYGRFAQPVWGYVSVVNRLPRLEWVLSYALATTEDVRVYARQQGEPDFHQLPELGEGAKWPFTGYRSASYLMTLQPNVPTEIVVRLHTRTPVGFHLLLSSTPSFIEADREQVVAAAFLSAVPLVVLVYVAILAAVLRQRGLIGLMIMLVTKLLMDAWVSGFGLLVLPIVPRASWSTLGFVLVMIFSLASVVHMRRYLDLPRFAPVIDRILLGFAFTFLLLCGIELTHLVNVRPISQSLAPFALIVFVTAAIRFAFRERTFGAACYALAWVLLLAQTIMQLSRLLALIPFPMETVEFAQSAIAALLFGVAIFRRVKDRDQALNRSLSDSNERFRLAIDGSAAAIYEYSFRDGAFSFAPRLAELLPVSAGTSLVDALRRLSTEARRRLLDGVRETVAGAGRHFRVEIPANHADSEFRVLAVTGAIQYAPEGAPERICGSVIDVTSEANLRIEQMLRGMVSEQKERAERSLHARTEFYAAANHDLRHPLLSLGLYLEMLAGETTLNKLRSFVPRMLDAHRAATLYLDRIVAMARADTNLLTDRRDESLDDILSRLVDRYHADAENKQLALSYVPTSLSVVTDAFLLERIVSNVISNAIQNTDRGRILIGCRRHLGGARIDVIDTGPGLPKSVHDQLIGAGDGAARREVSGSLRLGLSIVKRTVSELGCRLDVASYPGRGTRLSVVFPAFEGLS